MELSVFGCTCRHIVNAIRGPLMAGLAVVAVAASAPPAGAQELDPSDTADCVFAGNAATAPAVPFLFGEGAYNFTSVTGTCVVTGDPASNESGVVDVDIGSTGEYENIICGTGTVDSEEWEHIQDLPLDEGLLGGPRELSTPAVLTPAAVQSHVPPPPPALLAEFPVKLNYHVNFLAGWGDVRIMDWARDDVPLPAAGVRSGHADGVGGIGTGLMQIAPIGVPNPAANVCAAGFSVLGSVHFSLTD